jgi:hypothetical protein
MGSGCTIRVVAMGIVAVGVETARCGSQLAIANRTQLSSLYSAAFTFM